MKAAADAETRGWPQPQDQHRGAGKSSGQRHADHRAVGAAEGDMKKSATRSLKEWLDKAGPEGQQLVDAVSQVGPCYATAGSLARTRPTGCVFRLWRRAGFEQRAPRQRALSASPPPRNDLTWVFSCTARRFSRRRLPFAREVMPFFTARISAICSRRFRPASCCRCRCLRAAAGRCRSCRHVEMLHQALVPRIVVAAAADGADIEGNPSSRLPARPGRPVSGRASTPTRQLRRPH